MISAPPVTPLDDRFDSASEATLVPAVLLKVTAPRIGYITEVARVAAAAASLALDSKCTPSSARMSDGVGQHVHQVGNRRALVAGDIADAVFQQRLGDRQDALAAELARRHPGGVAGLRGQRNVRPW